MRASTYKELGKVAGTLRAISEGHENDPISREYGYFPDYTWDMNRAVVDAGFANLHHFYAEVERRTSSRWIHFHLPMFTHDSRKERAKARAARSS